MNKFPWLALGISLLFALIILQTDGHVPGSTGGLPLLMRLLMSEFAFLLNIAGVIVSIREMLRHGPSFAAIAAATGCLLLAGFFFYLAVMIWPVRG